MFCLCFYACLRSFTDWCIAHRQQSREQKRNVPNVPVPHLKLQLSDCMTLSIWASVWNDKCCPIPHLWHLSRVRRLWKCNHLVSRYQRHSIKGSLQGMKFQVLVQGVQGQSSVKAISPNAIRARYATARVDPGVWSWQPSCWVVSSQDPTRLVHRGRRSHPNL